MLSRQDAHDMEILNVTNFLNEEFKSKKKVNENYFTNKNLPGIQSDVPQQLNGYDCGIYLLQYVESFLLGKFQVRF